MSLEELAQKLRAGSEWSSLSAWEHLPEDRKQRWLRFAQMVQEVIHSELVEERMAVQRAWREAMLKSPVPLNVTVPQIPGNHTKALLRIFACLSKAPTPNVSAPVVDETRSAE
jgi:hypothetical protein